MDTPICDFVRGYREKNPLRLHMPGHKGIPFLGPEPLDLTEMTGADDLYHPEGIIAQSEENAAALFGAGMTCYSTEGSSQCIRAMLYLALQYAHREGKNPRILAGRNVHKTFVTAAGLLDFQVNWLPAAESYLSCGVADWKALEQQLVNLLPAAVYVTSPDYLGMRWIWGSCPGFAISMAPCCWWTTPTVPISTFFLSPVTPWIWERICAVTPPIRPCRP